LATGKADGGHAFEAFVDEALVVEALFVFQALFQFGFGLGSTRFEDRAAIFVRPYGNIVGPDAFGLLDDGEFILDA
jgi:hypothetical protein